MAEAICIILTMCIYMYVDMSVCVCVCVTQARNEAKDWGEAQLRSCADFCVHWNFQAIC